MFDLQLYVIVFGHTVIHETYLNHAEWTCKFITKLAIYSLSVCPKNTLQGLEQETEQKDT